jgi:Protein of unknown function (DUF998)
LHFLPTGYSPVHNAVSDYGAGSYSSLFRISLWSGSIAVLVLTVGLALGVGSPPLLSRDLVFLGLVAVAWIGESLFPTTVEGERLTRTGALHYLFAILTFGFTYAAISGLTPVLVKLHPWHSEKVWHRPSQAAFGHPLSGGRYQRHDGRPEPGPPAQVRPPRPGVRADRTIRLPVADGG